MKFPLWFNASKYNSLTKWIILFIERAIWINFNTFIKKSKDLPLLEIKNMWLLPENRLITFKNDILPYWTDL